MISGYLPAAVPSRDVRFEFFVANFSRKFLSTRSSRATRLNFFPEIYNSHPHTRKLARANISALSLSTLSFRLVWCTHACAEGMWVPSTRYATSYVHLIVLIPCVTRIYMPVRVYVPRMSAGQHTLWTNTLIKEKRPHYTHRATEPCYDYITLL